MTFLDFFAGIGTIRIGFEQAGWQCNGHVEWDKFAQASYNAMHDIKDGEFCGWDIRAVRADELPRSDLWTFGAPCQDFSIAGKRKGMDGERSSLVNEIFRLIEETPEENRPTWLLYENVKGMLSSNGGWDFLGILLEMDRLGYDVEWQLLNSKHFGVPQNRERVFTLGHLRTRGTRKVFPIGSEHEAVDELQGQHVGTLTTRTGASGSVGTYLIEGERVSQKVVGFDRKNGIGEELETAHTLNSTDWRELNRNQTQNAVMVDAKIAIPVSSPDYQTKNQNGRRFKEDGDPMFTLTAQDRHGVMIREATKKGYDIATHGDSVNLEQPNSKTRRGRVGKGVANTLTTGCQMGTVQDLRIRKLTPLEYWRLQGIPDHYFYKASAVNSDSQLYKQAGNACTVNVMYEIAKRI